MGPYIYDVHTEVWLGDEVGSSKFVTCLQILSCLNNRPIVYFSGWRSLGVTKLVIFIKVINVWLLIISNMKMKWSMKIDRDDTHDLQKDFDTLDHHEILLKKLKYIVFLPETVRWFKSSLKKWNLMVSFNQSLSEP